jgi:ParB/RepB/Spo0J family partition protein
MPRSDDAAARAAARARAAMGSTIEEIAAQADDERHNLEVLRGMTEPIVEPLVNLYVDAFDPLSPERAREIERALQDGARLVSLSPEAQMIVGLDVGSPDGDHTVIARQEEDGSITIVESRTIGGGSEVPRRTNAEALAEAHEQQISLIPEVRPEGQLRRVLVANITGGVEPPADLVGSIRAYGVFQPVALVAVDDAVPITRRQYVIAEGRRRVEGVRRVGYETIPAICYPAGTPRHVAAAMALAGNVIRRSNPIGEFESIREMVQAGASEEQIARELRIPIGTIRSRMRLANLTDGIMTFVQDGRIAVTLAERIARLPTLRQNQLRELLVMRIADAPDEEARARVRLTAEDVREVQYARQQEAVNAMPAEMFSTPFVGPGNVPGAPFEVVAPSALARSMTSELLEAAARDGSLPERAIPMDWNTALYVRPPHGVTTQIAVEQDANGSLRWWLSRRPAAIIAHPSDSAAGFVSLVGAGPFNGDYDSVSTTGRLRQKLDQARTALMNVASAPAAPIPMAELERTAELEAQVASLRTTIETQRQALFELRNGVQSAAQGSESWATMLTALREAQRVMPVGPNGESDTMFFAIEDVIATVVPLASSEATLEVLTAQDAAVVGERGHEAVTPVVILNERVDVAAAAAAITSQEAVLARSVLPAATVRRRRAR